MPNMFSEINPITTLTWYYLPKEILYKFAKKKIELDSNSFNVVSPIFSDLEIRKPQ